MGKSLDPILASFYPCSILDFNCRKLTASCISVETSIHRHSLGSVRLRFACKNCFRDVAIFITCSNYDTSKFTCCLHIMSEFLIARNLLLFSKAVFIVLKSDIFGQHSGNPFFMANNRKRIRSVEYEQIERERRIHFRHISYESYRVISAMICFMCRNVALGTIVCLLLSLPSFFFVVSDSHFLACVYASTTK